mgnify:CR=1 FL=1
MHYKWNPPVLTPGEQSNFYDHTGRLRTGECVRVETWYRSNGEARHNYSMRVEGRARRINVGDDCIRKQPPHAVVSGRHDKPE